MQAESRILIKDYCVSYRLVSKFSGENNKVNPKLTFKFKQFTIFLTNVHKYKIHILQRS